MRISFITKNTGYHSDQLKKTAKKSGFVLDVLNLKSANDLDSLGEIVIWRSATLAKKEVRNYLDTTPRIKSYFNKGVFENPTISQKHFQQQKARLARIPAIATHQINNPRDLKKLIQNGTLAFPFIAKPNVGSKGEGIYLFKTQLDIDTSNIPLKKYVFQNFISNQGDFRILVLGGKILGVIKRTAKKGSFLNNFSQGGSIEVVTDKDIIKKVSAIATKISALFNLSFCGVDVIYDTIEKKFLFLEVNTAPEWKGFQRATKINVSTELLNFCASLAKMDTKNCYANVEDYYRENLAHLQDRKFHFSSRMFLWNNDPFYKQQLRKLKKDYIGTAKLEYREKINELFHANSNLSGMMFLQRRKEFFEKYPNIFNYNKLLFRYLFSKSIYQLDLREIISEKLSDQEIVTLRQELLSDSQAIASLSTHAINFLYLSNLYLNQSTAKDDLLRFLAISRESSRKTNATDLSLRIYLLTHCIIGESAFYSRPITTNLETYRLFLQELEEIISKNYTAISLDAKFEFLVCCKICNYLSNIERLIQTEAQKSLSPQGIFFVDTLNTHANINQNGLSCAEHRNVLAIMSQQNYSKNA